MYIQFHQSPNPLYFLQNWLFRKQNSGGKLFHTWHLQLFVVRIQELQTMISPFEGEVFVESVYSAAALERVFLQSSTVYLFIFSCGSLRSFSKEKQTCLSCTGAAFFHLQNKYLSWCKQGFIGIIYACVRLCLHNFYTY